MMPVPEHAVEKFLIREQDFCDVDKKLSDIFEKLNNQPVIFAFPELSAQR